MASSVVAAGQRDKLVTIEADTSGVSASGFPTEGWATLGEAEWMSREPVMPFDFSGERFVSDQLTARNFDAWQMPYRSDMDPDLVNVPGQRRLRFQGRVFDILQADVLERSQIRLITLAKVG